MTARSRGEKRQKRACERVRVCITFIEDPLIAYHRALGRKPFILTPWQREFIIAVFRIVDDMACVVRTALSLCEEEREK